MQWNNVKYCFLLGESTFSSYIDVCLKVKDLPSCSFSNLSLSLPLHVQWLLFTLLLEKESLGNTAQSTFWDCGNVLYLHCPVPIVTMAIEYFTSDQYMERLILILFDLILINVDFYFNSHVWRVATLLDSVV